MRRLAIVNPSNPVAELTETGNPRYVAFFKELRRLGYVEGQNIAVERYSGQGRTEHYAELAREVVGRNPDLILTNRSLLVSNFKALRAPSRSSDSWRTGPLRHCRKLGKAGGQYHWR